MTTVRYLDPTLEYINGKCPKNPTQKGKPHQWVAPEGPVKPGGTKLECTMCGSRILKAEEATMAKKTPQLACPANAPKDPTGWHSWQEVEGEKRLWCSRGKHFGVVEKKFRTEDGKKRTPDVVEDVKVSLAELQASWKEAVPGKRPKTAEAPAPEQKKERAERTPAPTGDISSLIKQLKSETDPAAKRKIRATLRKLGHRGGLRKQD